MFPLLARCAQHIQFESRIFGQVPPSSNGAGFAWQGESRASRPIKTNTEQIQFLWDSSVPRCSMLFPFAFHLQLADRAKQQSSKARPRITSRQGTRGGDGAMTHYQMRTHEIYTFLYIELILIDIYMYPNLGTP